jgi:hypothetical protein
MDTIRPWLYVGKHRETLDANRLRARGIGAMLQLAEAVEHVGIASLYLPVHDGLPLPNHLLRQGVDFVLAEKRRGRTVLIACGAGMSRSVVFAVAVLKEAEGLSLLEAVRVVKQHHSGSMPHPALWKSLCAYYGEEIPFPIMLRVLWDSDAHAG